jgi:hypothetical protein
MTEGMSDGCRRNSGAGMADQRRDETQRDLRSRRMTAATARPLSETLAWSYADDVPPVSVAPGVAARSLWRDELGRHAVVVEILPGAILQRSTADDAQIATFVMSGEVTLDGRRHGQGAFVYCPAGREATLSSDDGALLIVMKFSGGDLSPLSWKACSPPVSRLP